MITDCISKTLQQLEQVLHLLSDEHYAQPLKLLSDASIGQHVRHIIEFLQCLEEGYDTGEVNYDHRKRDIHIENNRSVALSLLERLVKDLPAGNKELLLSASCSAASDDSIQIPSSYYRELLYNLEHIIHHMAIIRIGIKATAAVDLPEEFGFATATIKHHRTCAPSASSR